jgi:hypothetical protein
MKFERVRSGEYRSQLRGGTYIWVSREGRHTWVWCLGGRDGYNMWETDNNGPFPTKREAIKDASRNYQDYL